MGDEKTIQTGRDDGAGPSPRGLESLAPADRRDVIVAIRQLRQVWIEEDRSRAIVETIAPLLPESLALLFETWPGRAGFSSISTGVVSHAWADVPSLEEIARLLVERWTGCLGTKEAVVTTADLARTCPEAARDIHKALGETSGLRHLVAARMSHRGEVVGCCAFFRGEEDGEYGGRERRIVECVAPAVHEGLIALDGLARLTLSRADLVQVLDLLDEPAFLASDDGRPLIGNSVAKATFGIAPRWLSDLLRHGGEGRASLPRTITSLRLDGGLRLLVLPRGLGPGASAPDALAQWDLPPALARVTSLILRGLSDKEIATEADLSVATVRTYVARIYQRLGVCSRFDLFYRAFCESTKAS